MTRDKFDKIVDMIDEKFGLENREIKELAGGSGCQVEIVEFKGPMGNMRLEFTEKGRLVGETTSYSKRIGAPVKVDKQYDIEDRVSFMKAFQWQEGSETWQEIDAAALTSV